MLISTMLMAFTTSNAMLDRIDGLGPLPDDLVSVLGEVDAIWQKEAAERKALGEMFNKDIHIVFQDPPLQANGPMSRYMCKAMGVPHASWPQVITQMAGQGAIPVIGDDMHREDVQVGNAVFEAEHGIPLSSHGQRLAWRGGNEYDRTEATIEQRTDGTWGLKDVWVNFRRVNDDDAIVDFHIMQDAEGQLWVRETGSGEALEHAELGPIPTASQWSRLDAEQVKITQQGSKSMEGDHREVLMSMQELEQAMVALRLLGVEDEEDVNGSFIQEQSPLIAELKSDADTADAAMQRLRDALLGDLQSSGMPAHMLAMFTAEIMRVSADDLLNVLEPSFIDRFQRSVAKMQNGHCGMLGSSSDGKKTDGFNHVDDIGDMFDQTGERDVTETFFPQTSRAVDEATFTFRPLSPGNL